MARRRKENCRYVGPAHRGLFLSQQSSQRYQVYLGQISGGNIGIGDIVRTARGVFALSTPTQTAVHTGNLTTAAEALLALSRQR